MCVFYIILLCLTLYILSRVQKIIIHTLDVCWCFESCLWLYVLGLLNDLMTWRRWVEMTSNESVTHLRQGCGRLQEQCLQGSRENTETVTWTEVKLCFFSALQLCWDSTFIIIMDFIECDEVSCWRGPWCLTLLQWKMWSKMKNRAKKAKRRIHSSNNTSSKRVPFLWHAESCPGFVAAH